MKRIICLMISTLVLQLEALGADSQTTAKSTSPLIAIAFKDATGTTRQPSEGTLLQNGGCYATIGVASARVFAHVNWLHAIVDSKALAFASTKLTGKSSGNVAVSDTRVGTPRPIHSGDTIDDMGLGVVFLDAVPWDFSSLHLDLSIDSSADSTITTIANGVSSVSKEIPAFQLSAAVNAGLSIAQVFDKLLFDSERTTARLSGAYDLVAVGKSTLLTGCYVVFGSDNAPDYAKYLTRDGSGNSQLVWDTPHLLFGGKEVDDVSYFILTVESQTNLYANADAALSSGRQWAAPFLSAELSIDALVLATDQQTKDQALKTIKDEITKGQTLLAADPDILFTEKRTIFKAILDRLNSAVTKSATKAIEATQVAQANPDEINRLRQSHGSKMFMFSYIKPNAAADTPEARRNKLILENVLKNKASLQTAISSFEGR